jgi:hypothetical protein
MNTTKDDATMFASENTIFRIVSIAKILSWILLVFFLIIFVVNNLIPIFDKQMQWPTQFPQLLLTIVDLFYPPALGLFYFLVLQGVAQGLNLGLDIYYGAQPEDDEEPEEELETLSS